ncbi:hypothetical protein FB45DRAFT_840590, partial [Roridomyces roridus]
MLARLSELFSPATPKPAPGSLDVLNLSVDDIGPVVELAEEIFKECQAAFDKDALRRAIMLLRHAALAWLSTDRKLRPCLLFLCGMHQRQFILSGCDDPAESAVIYLLQGACRGPVDLVNLTPILTMGETLGYECAPTTLKCQAGKSYARFLQSMNTSESSLDTVIFLLRQVLYPAPNHGKALALLCRTLLIRSDIKQKREAAEDVIPLLRRLYALQPNRQVLFCMGLLGQGTNEKEIMEISRTRAASQKEALELLKSGCIQLMSAADSLSQINAAISLLHRAEAQLSWGHHDRAELMITLAAALLQRYRCQGNSIDLEWAINLNQDVLRLDSELVSPTSHAAALTNLAIAYRAHMTQSGDLKYLEKIIQLHSEALAIRAPPHPEHINSLTNLAIAIRERYMQYGDISDLKRAIQLQHTAADLPMAEIPWADRGAPFSNLAISLKDLSLKELNPSYLDESIQLHEKALVFRPVPHRERASSLDGLGLSLVQRFHSTGTVTDLDRAVEIFRESLVLHSGAHPDRQGTLPNLALSLLTRFDERGEDVDLDNAIGLHRQSLALASASNLNRFASQNNLAFALLRRFQARKDTKDIDDACHLCGEALKQLTPSHPSLVNAHTNLGYALRVRHEHLGGASDIQDCIQHHRTALDLTPDGHPYRGLMLDSLATSISKTMKHNEGYNTYFESARDMFQESLALCPNPHPHRSYSLLNLAVLLMRRHTQFPDPELVDAAMEAFREASEYSVSSVRCRFHASRFWAMYADLHEHPSVLAAYSTALELLPQMVLLGSNVSAQLKNFDSFEVRSIVSEAAACAVRLSNLEKAVEFIEAGRSVFWQQGLQLRTSLDDLHRADPELGARAADLMRKLDRGSHRQPQQLPAESADHMMYDAESKRLRELNSEWLKTLDQIRSKEDFHDFLRPKTFTTLKAAASNVNGFVVILNINTHAFTGTALILDGSANIRTVTFKDSDINSAHLLLRQCMYNSVLKSLLLNKDMLGGKVGMQQILEKVMSGIQQEQSTQLVEKPEKDDGLIPEESIQFMQQSEHFTRLVGTPEKDEGLTLEESMQFILAELWNTIVEPVIRELKLEKSANPPRICWCPTGPLAFLPIHAAGIYSGSQTDCVHDYAISSYTPTVTALLPSVSTKKPSPFKMTVVIEPKAHSQNYLPSVKAE